MMVQIILEAQRMKAYGLLNEAIKKKFLAESK